MKRSLLLLTLTAASVVGVAHGKPKKSIAPPALFREARYVYVESSDGGPLAPGLLAEDRQAIFDVQKALQSWNRYVLTIRREEAQLLFVVRSGRIVSADAHVGVNAGSRSPNNRVDPGATQQPDNAGGGVEVGPQDDLLTVYTLDADGKLGTRIWMKSEPNGLHRPGVPLLKEVQSEVDAAYPRN